MNSFRSRSNSSNRFGLFADFVIIIAGIMVSFLLNEWRENRNKEEKKIILLTEIKQDLKADSLYLYFSEKTYKELQRGHDSMLTFPKKGFHIDSISMYLDYFVSYMPFKPSERAYINLTNDPDLSIDLTDTNGVDYLINKYSIIRSQLYNSINEWELIDKNFVLNTTLPYLETNAPFMHAPPGKSFNGKVFETVSKDDHFKNLVKSGALYKSILAQNYALASRIVGDLQKEINIYLETLSKD
ncbi:MAG: hypothetical protein KDB74_00770 [Flavobacteriales bacterium]|nr:hypothetical protein [Flavobacteriales bacterium]